MYLYARCISRTSEVGLRVHSTPPYRTVQLPVVRALLTAVCAFRVTESLVGIPSPDPTDECPVQVEEKISGTRSTWQQMPACRSCRHDKADHVHFSMCQQWGQLLLPLRTHQCQGINTCKRATTPWILCFHRLMQLGHGALALRYRAAR